MVRKAFTLIELLIVVAIIAILAAIAVPNFLEAQTRSKVSRVKADMRTLDTAIRSYQVDTNKYPMHGHPAPNAQDFDNDCAKVKNGTSLQVLHYWVTTPVAYIASLSASIEPFTEKSTAVATDEAGQWVAQHLNYACFQEPWNNAAPASRDFAIRTYSMWRLASAGPDRQYFKSATGAFLVQTYDPTNGTVSVGDIMRTEASPEFLRP